MGISVFFVVVFLILFLLGHRFSQCKIWKYIDVIYYPLGAIAVITLFLQQVTDREIVESLDRISAIQIELREAELVRPSLESTVDFGPFIEKGGKNLEKISVDAEICNASNLKNGQCHAASDFNAITKKYQSKFLINIEDNDVVALCESGNDLVDEFEISGMMNNLISYLRHGFDSSYQMEFSEFDFGAISSHIGEISELMDVRVKQILIGIKNENDREFATGHLHAQAEYIAALLRSYQICFVAPEEILNGEYAIWNRNMREAKTLLQKELKNKETRERKRNNPEIYSIWVRLNYFVWPYILIFALSLKFGKAISSLRN